MNPKKRLASNLAAALASGAWDREAIERRVAALLGPRAPKSRAKLIDHILRKTATPYAPPPDRLAELILDATTFDRVARSTLARAHGIDPVLEPPAAVSLPPLADLPIPRLGSERDLAEWLGTSLSDLDWFADARRQHRHTAAPALQHYAYAWLPKRSGAPRLIEAPKSRLKEIQRQILRDILDPLPPHDAAHGFVKGRSCLGAAARHGGEAVVVTVDLKDFFLNVPPRRVHGLFRSLGFPWAVARPLTGLCTTATPDALLDAAPVGWAARRCYREPHLPQGAPTSPALANLCSWRLDCRLAGLARRFEANYTRYADDLAFSGDAEFAGRLGRFFAALRLIVGDAGFALNPAKTRIMRQSGRQRITGLVVNRHLNVARGDFDRLKATLYNCARHGPESQNRDGHGDFRSHLDGRVTWVETVNPNRGLRLREIFEVIDWPAGAG